ncbi:MAG: hypothetical protein ACHQNV_09660, partial [Vicinamibacteria bacterium]
MSPVAEERDVFRATFDGFVATVAGQDPAWLRDLRTAAMARFAERGFPTTRDEAWRHTSVAPLARTVFRPAEERSPEGAAGGVLADLRLTGEPAVEAVFVNGRYAPALSTSRGEARVLSLREARARQPERLEPHLGRLG